MITRGILQGYDPEPYPGMTFSEWRETFGSYCWYHEDGTPRTQYPLDYNWEAVYKTACDTADIALAPYLIEDIPIFTSDFLSSVPINWLKYKTMLELMSGQLDGYTINPETFEAGFTRKTTATTGDTLGETASSGYTSNVNSTDVSGARTDTQKADGENKSRSINYAQGVKAYNALNPPDDIGKLGNSYASSMADNIGYSEANTTSNTGAQTNTSKSNYTGSEDAKHNSSRDIIFNEDITEKRINYYDNLAFLRDRADRLKLLTPFHELFLPLFTSVSSLSGFWS